MIASGIFVKLKSKVESKSISCKILPNNCLAAMSKKPKYSCKFQKEWRTGFDFVQPSRLGVNHVYCSFCNADFRLNTVSVTVLSLVLHLKLGVSMIMMPPGISLPQENSGTESPTQKFISSQGWYRWPSKWVRLRAWDWEDRIHWWSIHHYIDP